MNGERPRNPIAQFGYDAQSRNAYDNSVVIIDEYKRVAAHVR